MKKILLSSIIMLGVCGAVSAQTTAKGKRTDASVASTSAAAPAPQKAAVIPASDDAAPVATPATRTTADKEAAAAAPAAPQTKAQIKAAQAAQSTSATTVNAAGEVITSDEAKVKAEKAAAVKAAGEKNNQQ